jgi:hypothetical protein
MARDDTQSAHFPFRYRDYGYRHMDYLGFQASPDFQIHVPSSRILRTTFVFTYLTPLAHPTADNLTQATTAEVTTDKKQVATVLDAWK